MAAPRKKSTGATSLTTGPDSAEVMKAMRDVLGLSQDRFAAKVGLKQQQISAYENRNHSASLVTLAEIAEKAGVRLEVTVHAPGGAEPGKDTGV